MKNKTTKTFISAIIFITAFIIWTILITTVDVRPVGINLTNVGLSSVNIWFYSITGSNMLLYTVTDWLGLVPVFVCMAFGLIGLAQLIKRKSLLKVEPDIIFLGVYYVIVIMGYVMFEMIPINYRPVLIDGVMESSYPSSTTLLVLSVMPTLIFQLKRKIKNKFTVKSVSVITVLFSVFMVVGRLVSGVHWLTDIIGSVLLSAGLFCVYKAVVLLTDKS